ncbi:MAG TPA: phosphotransferase [Herpetosiphonaceae bacterium]|nr:phosphotransferase [Herpetosiphonaceae bacterium]
MVHAGLDMKEIEALCSRIFGPGSGLRVARVAEGVSTYVFRVERAGEAFYLRVLPEEGASFAPEVLAHRLLRERGVHVPEVVYWEHYNPALDRSVMLTTEIKGHAIREGSEPGALRDVLVAAGHDLALTNTIPVQHFGWVRRDRADVVRLEGEVASLREWLLVDLDKHLALLLRHGFFPARTIARIGAIVAAFPRFFDGDQAYLAHGDFDPTHIYHDHGVYSGIIDWGEIRGTQPLYDLGHFSMDNGPMLPYVLEGYREVAQLPADFEQRIHLASLFVAIGRLAGGLLKHPPRPAFAPYVDAVERAVSALSS